MVQRHRQAAIDMELLARRTAVVREPLSAKAAVAFALSHNLQTWIARQEYAIASEQAKAERARMLPSLMAGFQWRDRSRPDASRSVSVSTGLESLEPSFSREQESTRIDLTLAWNLIDFGVGYLRARQADNRVRITEEQVRRVRQNLAMEAWTAYWRAQAARDAADRARGFVKRIETSIASLEREIESQTVGKVEGLGRLTQLEEHRLALMRLIDASVTAEAELGRVIGAAAGARLPLASVDLDRVPAAMDVDVIELERRALLNRPELFEQDYAQLIAGDEARAALAQMLPNPGLLLRYEHDQDRLIVFNNWYTLGLQMSWNLLNIPERARARDAADARAKAAAEQRAAIAAGILTQLHLALLQLDQAERECGRYRRLASHRSALAEAVGAQAGEGKASTGQVLEHEVRALLARARYLEALTQLHAARARVWNTVGVDPEGQQDEGG